VTHPELFVTWRRVSLPGWSIKRATPHHALGYLATVSNVPDRMRLSRSENRLLCICTSPYGVFEAYCVERNYAASRTFWMNRLRARS